MSPKQWSQSLKSAWKTTKTEIHHYWSGFKLLGYEISISQRLLRKNLRGDELTRRESRQLTRTTGDIFRMIPFVIVIAVPFMELLLPVILFVFPNFLPSTFTSKKKREEDIKKKTKSRLEIANFLQETISQNAKYLEKTTTGETKIQIQHLSKFLENVREGGVVSPEEILEFAPLFNDELTLDNLDKIQLVGLCQYLGLNTFGSNYLLRARIRSRLAELKADDLVILREGIERLDEDELRSACRARGMRGAYGDGSIPFMRREINDWIDLSVHRSLPSSLLLLSRVFALTSQTRQAMVRAQNIDVKDIGKTIQVLPDELIMGVEADHIQDLRTEAQKRIEFLKQEEEEIKLEQKQMKEAQEKDNEKEEEQAEEEATKQVDEDQQIESKEGGEQKDKKQEEKQEEKKDKSQKEQQELEEKEQLTEKSEALEKENEQKQKEILEDKAPKDEFKESDQSKSDEQSSKDESQKQQVKQ